jgi:hypothetical protein
VQLESSVSLSLFRLRRLYVKLLYRTGGSLLLLLRCLRFLESYFACHNAYGVGIVEGSVRFVSLVKRFWLLWDMSVVHWENGVPVKVIPRQGLSVIGFQLIQVRVSRHWRVGVYIQMSLISSRLTGVLLSLYGRPCVLLVFLLEVLLSFGGVVHGAGHICLRNIAFLWSVLLDL